MRLAFAYPMEIRERGGAFHARFPDLPTVRARGSSPSKARAKARERLPKALAGYVLDRKDVPRPSPARGRDVAAPPVLMAAKLALYQTMREQRVSNVALARRLGTVEGTVRRLVSPLHRSRIDAVEGALALLGKELALQARAGAGEPGSAS